MTGMLLALFLYLLVSRFNRPARELYECHGCHDLVHFDGRRFVHADTGAVEAIDWPERHVDVLDDSSPLQTHRAVPIDYPLGRVA